MHHFSLHTNGIWAAVCFDFAKCFFTKFIQNVKMCFMGIFKML